MWFVLLAIALALLTASGLYVRRRLGWALRAFGVGTRPVRLVRWVMAWLLFGYPLLVIGSIVVSRIRGQATLPRFDGLVASWLLDLAAHSFSQSPTLAEFEGRVSDSGEGRWTSLAAIDVGAPTPILTTALYERFTHER